VTNGTATREATGRMKVYVLVNALTCGSDDQLPAELDGGPRMLSTMRRTGTFHGHPVYDGTCVILSHRPGTPVVPVTRERWLRLHTEYFRRQLAKVAEARAQLVQMHASLDEFDQDVARLRQHVQDLDGQLAAMPPAERTAPAWVHESHGDTALVAPDTPDAVPLQQVNTAFVDRALPNDAPQAIAVVIGDGILESTWQNDGDRAFRWQIAQRVRDGIDWAALEAMLRP
jgi:hypothetical protein